MLFIAGIVVTLYWGFTHTGPFAWFTDAQRAATGRTPRMMTLPALITFIVSQVPAAVAVLLAGRMLRRRTP